MKTSEGEALYIYDICGTLYSCNTTFEFCEWFERRPVYKAILKISKSLPFKILNRLLEKLFAFELIRFLHIYALKNHSEARVEAKALEFVREVLVNKKILPVHSLLINCNRKNVVLVSATILPIAKAIAFELGVPKLFASTLNIVDGIYSGTVDDDLLGNKHKLFEHDEIALVVTDNKSDYALCITAKKVVIVSSQRNLDFWKSKNIANSSIIKV